MAEIRLSKLIKQFNIGLDTLVEFLNSKGAGIEDANPNLKVSDEFLPELHKKFGKDLELKEQPKRWTSSSRRFWTRPPRSRTRMRTSSNPSAGR
jgi:translation initiation factor IF-2